MITEVTAEVGGQGRGTKREREKQGPKSTLGTSTTGDE